MTDENVILETAEELSLDPVCGVSVEIEDARDHDLVATFADREYTFCGTWCRDQFLGAPKSFAVSGRSEP